MTDERKKQIVLFGSIAVAALILVLFFRGRGASEVSAAEVPVDGASGTPGLVTLPSGGYTTFNIPPYVPPSNGGGGGITINSPSLPSLPQSSACPCPKVCDGAPTYFASENSFLNSPPPTLLNWYSNMPMPQPIAVAPQPIISRDAMYNFIKGGPAMVANSLAAAQNALAQAIGYG